jgi:quinol monooxygenase YgiN
MSMLIRFVKLEFQPEHAETFAAFFAEEAKGIRAYPGCSHVEAFRDLDNPNRFFTRSHWDSAEALEAYRASDFFRGNWKTVKAWFSAKPEAWSVEAV